MFLSRRLTCLRIGVSALLSLGLASCTRKSSPNVLGGAGAEATAQPAAGIGDLPPCDVANLIKQHCIECHGSMRHFGAPISLTSASAFRAPLDNSTVVGQVVLERVQNSPRPMPPVTRPPLSQTEIAILQNWIAAGAPAVSDGCPIEDAPPPSVASDAGSTSSGQPLPPTGVGGSAALIDAGTPSNPVAVPDAGSVKPPATSADWPMFGRDLQNTRANLVETKLSEINVRSLRRVWEFKGPASTSTPAIVDGVVYLPAWDAKLHALRAEDGKEVWTSMLPNLIDSSPAVSASQIFLSDNHGSVHGLERATGHVQWSTPVDMTDQAHLWSSPVYIESVGLVVVGVASGQEQQAQPESGYTFHGSVVALDAKTGIERWRLHTADGNSGPGVAVWGTAAVDVQRKLVFIGTGNNYQAPTGDLSDSLLAIEFETGKLAWSVPFTKNDIFTVFSPGGGPDSDIGSSANLFSVGGQDWVGVGIKNGTYVALDRDHGKPQWMAMLGAGSVLGGVISASAYAHGVIYVASNDGSSATLCAALDSTTGKILWKSPSQAGTLTYGGLAYANEVIYWGTDSGSLSALDASDGKTLWNDQLSDSIAGSPSIANGMLFVPWGYQWTLLNDGVAGSGGLIAYGL
jgi:polyvinyl alcohol dehydrogenase (cytochrome)